MKEKKSSSITIQYVIIIGILLLLTNTALGAVMMIQSTNTIQQLVRENMLNISNTAADIISGEELASITEDSVGNETWQRIHSQLTVFQDNVDIEYIYTVRKLSEEDYIFLIDADPEDPAEYGEEVLITPALISAGNGTARVDDDPAEDEWGNFYSAYSPVFDSRGKQTGIVGIDYSSEWYDRQLYAHTISIGVVTALSVLIGAVLVLLLTNRIRERFVSLSKETALLSEDVEMLTKEIVSSRYYQESIAGSELTEETDEGDQKTDEIEALGSRIRSMHAHLRQYLDFIQIKASTDALTGVGNTASYLEAQQDTEEKMKNGGIFSIVIFDINDLKKVNDKYGHKTGDVIIQGAAEAISFAVGRENTYRIGGDEFVAILMSETEDMAARKIQKTQEAVTHFNETNPDLGAVLSLSSGAAEYDPAKDITFKDVFVRADENLYENKREYHRNRTE